LLLFCWCILACMHNDTTGERGHRLRANRERLGITRTRLAALAGCSTTTLVTLEGGVLPSGRSLALDRAEAALAEIEAAAGDPA